MDEQLKPKSWWETIPGIVTAIATVITAIAGLILALNQAGLIGQHSGDSPSNKVVENRSASTRPEKDVPSGAVEQQPISRAATSDKPSDLKAEIISLPDKIKVGPVLYQLSSGQIHDYSEGKKLFKFHLRVINTEATYGYNISGDNFRVYLDDIPISPNDFPIEVVDFESSKEGDVSFVLPADARLFRLQLGYVRSEDTRSIDVSY